MLNLREWLNKNISSHVKSGSMNKFVEILIFYFFLQKMKANSNIFESIMKLEILT